MLGVDSPIQEGLLSLAHAERWTVRALQEQVEKNKLARRTRGGRRPQSRMIKSLRTIRKCLVEQREALGDVHSVDRDELREVMTLLEETRMSLDGMVSSLLNAQNDEAVPESCSKMVACIELEAS